MCVSVWYCKDPGVLGIQSIKSRPSATGARAW